MDQRSMSSEPINGEINNNCVSKKICVHLRNLRTPLPSIQKSADYFQRLV